METSCDAKPTAVEQWEDAVRRLASGLGAQPGLMHVPMAQALHAVAPVPRAVAANPAATAAAAAGAHAPAKAPVRRPAEGSSSGSELAWNDWWQTRERLASGELTAQDVAKASLQRLEQVHATTGACVELLHESAMRQARECDERIAAGQEAGLLAGMPLAHKDLLLRSGSEFGYGMARAGGVADVDATVLSKLDAAGALHLARLHMTEIAFDPAGVNEMAGHCRNPWSSEHIPGGSSSGSAGVVAAGAVVGAIGSDTGGSIRIPSVLCGVTGLKPTFGLVSRAGAMTLSQTNDHLGPIARSARDCALMLHALAGPDVGDAGSVAAPEGNGYLANLDRPIQGIRIGVPQSYFTRDLHPDVDAMLRSSVEHFREMGAEVRAVPDFPYDDLNALAILIIRAEATAIFGEMARSPESALGAFTRSRLEEGVAIPASLYLRALGMRGPLLMQFVKSVMADVDVLMAPVFPQATPRISEFDELDERSQFLRQELTRLTRPINFLGLPSLVLPGGFVRDQGGTSLPTGFQLIGRPYAESLLLQMGHAFQTATAWDPAQMPMPAAMPWD